MNSRWEQRFNCDEKCDKNLQKKIMQPLFHVAQPLFMLRMYLMFVVWGTQPLHSPRQPQSPPPTYLSLQVLVILLQNSRRFTTWIFTFNFTMIWLAIFRLSKTAVKQRYLESFYPFLYWFVFSIVTCLYCLSGFAGVFHY